MKGLDHLEHLDKQLVDELAQVARETVRDELREQTRRQRRTATLYAASGAVALYAGAALALAVGLALAIGLPGWAAALITAAILGAAAYALREAARPSASHPAPGPGTDFASGADTGAQRTGGTGATTGAAGRAAGAAYPPTPPVPPVPPAPPAGTTRPDHPGGSDPGPQHRA
ncbi:phage holin family protein [Streptomyces sp. NPDC042207]|uniref:phage holin family protein n=1 Tax=Streptomyces sp. NPDC042207 TaxID=3154331 RepID=UPI0033C71467